ncbi:hypothetical protein SSTU70S_01562 [Stutzerimonas stutzeri]
MAVDDQQAVVDAVEQCLQALLAVHQGLHVGLLELEQRLRHQAEAPAQRRQLGDGRSRQFDAEVAAPDLVGGCRQLLDRRAEASGEAVRGDEADQQHGDTGQTEQAGQQHGAFAAAYLGVADRRVGALLHVHHQGADLIEGLAQLIFLQQRPALAARRIQHQQEARVGAGDALEGLTVVVVARTLHAALQRRLESRTRRAQRLVIAVVAQQDDQVVAERLAQLLVDLDDAEVVADQVLLALGHLHDADQRQQQAEQRYRH